jgi:very-short-patch-repair endonuclease
VNEKAWEIVRDEAQCLATRFEERFSAIAGYCESPIEEILLAALYSKYSGPIPEVELHFMGRQTPKEKPYFECCAFVYQQVELGPYRVDFLIQDVTLSLRMQEPRYIVVECDGHDFHERTKEQARRDRSRDRYLQSLGYKILRFTGSEIWADPDKCTDEIIDHLTLFGGACPK